MARPTSRSRAAIARRSSVLGGRQVLDGDCSSAACEQVRPKWCRQVRSPHYWRVANQGAAPVLSDGADVDQPYSCSLLSSAAPDLSGPSCWTCRSSTPTTSACCRGVVQVLELLTRQGSAALEVRRRQPVALELSPTSPYQSSVRRRAHGRRILAQAAPVRWVGVAPGPSGARSGVPTGGRQKSTQLLRLFNTESFKARDSGPRWRPGAAAQREPRSGRAAAQRELLRRPGCGRTA